MSVDTRHLDTAREVLARGLADAINWTGTDDWDGVSKLAAETGAGLVLMAQGCADWRVFEAYAKRAQTEYALKPEQVLFDPGVGFTATREEDREIFDALPGLCRKLPILLGVSRKRIIAEIAGSRERDVLDAATAGAAIASARLGVAVFRVHNVAATVAAFRAFEAIDGNRMQSINRQQSTAIDCNRQI